MDTTEWILAGIIVLLALMVFGQYLSGTADYFLSIENPRPLDDNVSTITVLYWASPPRAAAPTRRTWRARASPTCGCSRRASRCSPASSPSACGAR